MDPGRLSVYRGVDLTMRGRTKVEPFVGMAAPIRERVGSRQDRLELSELVRHNVIRLREWHFYRNGASHVVFERNCFDVASSPVLNLYPQRDYFILRWRGGVRGRYRARGASDAQDHRRGQHHKAQWAKGVRNVGGCGLGNHGYEMYRPFLAGSAQVCLISHIDVISRGSYDARTNPAGWLTLETP